MADGSICSIQVGADYNHLWDAHYTYLATADEANSVFVDAEELFAWLIPTPTTDPANSEEARND